MICTVRGRKSIMAAIEKYNAHTHHGEDGHGAPVFDFTEQSIRKGFIRKVYAILMSQLLVTMGVIAFFMFHEPTKEFVSRNEMIIFWAASIVGFVCVIVMVCCTEVRRTAPMNFIFLAIFTIAESLLLGVVTCLYEVSEVYAILMSQLLVTMGVIAFFMFHEPTKEFVSRNEMIIFWAASIVGFVCVIVMVCCTEVRRTAPMNFIFLAIFTIAESLLLGVVTCLYEVSEVMIAVGITAAVCLGLTIFAFQTKWDFTMWGGMLVAATVVLLVSGIHAMIFKDKMANQVLTSAGAFIFSLYLVYDTQLMMGGKHKYSISPEEYIFAALNIYLDIIIIFLRILRLVAGR